MRAIRIPVYYDFASTICYVAQRAMTRLAPLLHDLVIDLAWIPIDLSLLTGFRRGDEMDPVRRANAMRVAHELGVTARVPTSWLDSRPAAALAMRFQGTSREAAWRERVFSGVFEEGLDPGALDSLARWLRELRADEMLAWLSDPAQRIAAYEELSAATRTAAELQVTGVPTFMLGEWPFGGIQEDATMRQILTRFVTRRREAEAGVRRPAPKTAP